MRSRGVLIAVGVILALALTISGAVATGLPVSATESITSKEAIVLSRLPYGLACNMVDDGTFSGSWVYCWVGSGAHPARHAKLNLNGQFSVTATTALPQGLGGPGQPFGTNVDLGPFLCVPLHTGVKCTVLATGKGFLISQNGAVAVGLSSTSVGGVAAPIFGHTATLKTVSGTVLVERPATTSFVPLSAVTSVALGTIVDTTSGTVKLTAATGAHGGTETGLFYSGIFRITQTKARSPLRGGRSVGLTVLTLAGALPSGCGATVSKATLATSHTTRRLWGNAHGNFRTDGRDASATVRGTKWLTEDTCTGTLVKVARGVVSVENLRTHKTVLVRAGRSFLSGSSAASTSSAILWTALVGKVICGPAIPHGESLLCSARVVPAPEHTSPLEGDPGFVFLSSQGQPKLARLSQASFEGEYDGAHEVPLKSGETWRRGTLGVTCTISSAAVRCANRSNHGFTITKGSYSAF
jgi:hypothetical protein